ncbi:MAG: HAD family hydrolase [Erysipelotrichaceae bacterium]|nr:HAD family hydrolase [Erysipelotrichaceae bacterium]
MIKTLIFDLDNTLIDRQRAFREMLYRKFNDLFEDKDLIDQMVNDIMIWDNNGAVERIVVFKRWAEKYNVTCISPEKLEQDWSNESGSVAFLYDDVRETLTELKKKYKIGLLSNGNTHSQRRKINTIKIDDLIDYSLVSGEYICKKPDERIFKYVCEQMDSKPEECIYIGDSYHIDVEGSRNAGLNPIFVSRKGEEYNDVTTIYQIKELLDIL